VRGSAQETGFAERVTPGRVKAAQDARGVGESLAKARAGALNDDGATASG